MGKFRVELTSQAKKDLAKHKQYGDKVSAQNIKKILEELKEHPYTGTGRPEALKYVLTGLWSRRINQKDRMIYEVKDNIVTVTVISARGHYFDK